MTLPTGTELNAGTTCKVISLPPNARSPVAYIITARAAVVSGDRAITVSSNAPVYLQEGTKLAFGATTVEVVTDTSVGTAVVSLPIKPAPAAIAIDSTATTIGLLQVLGGDSLEFQITDNEVSTRSFENGLWDDARKVMLGGSMPWSGHYVKGDPAITKVIEPAAFSASEVWVEVTRSDGKVRKGAAMIKDYKENLKLDDIIRLTWTFRFVGEIYQAA